MSYDLDWANLAFGSKKPINSLNAILIAAPREISQARFKQLVKEYLPAGNLVLGLSKDTYVAGFEDQPHFKTLQAATVQKLIDKVNQASANKIYTLHYAQRESNYVLEQLNFKQAVLVNGSWLHAFHNTEAFYTLVRRNIPIKLVSAFADEAEARAFEGVATKELSHSFKLPKVGDLLTEQEMLAAAATAAKYSFDYSFQTGASLGKKRGQKYALLGTAFNKVVPHQTYAMLHGASRETHMSPPHDLNHYDTVHAEIQLLTRYGGQLKGATAFINLLPCPPCARALADSDIAEVVYQADHSSGYAVAMLEAAGKTVRRTVYLEP